MEETNTGAAMPAKRPTFLTVLCILSFVGIAFSLIGGIMNYFTYSTLASAGSMLGDMSSEGGKEMGAAMNAMADVMGMDYGKMAMVALIQALLNIPILIGVLMMWKQKKTGFYVYAAFEIIQPALPLIMGLGLVGGIMATVGLIFGVVFVVLYGLNLKHMS
ncbi:MAG: hypothetical protein A3F72_15470 [Bacteroidetes bacterium RIFCSPLOWO2_12_FULL_35_15]|nr:MAG: hypothetical protein A3F72_15470 [Bacteroidetes bacterium RIFCSPLOWO2_12_FULL_35_15]